MAQVQYVGPSHERVIRKSDLKSIGFEDVDGIHLYTRDKDGVNKLDTAEVPQDVAEWLVKNEKGDWKIINEDGSEAEVVEEEVSFPVTPEEDDTPDGFTG